MSSLMKTFRVSVAVVTTLALSLAGVRDALAVAKIHVTGVVIEQANGSPLAQATITIAFGDKTMTAKTDDDGVIPLLLLPSGGTATDADKDKVVLIGDGSGTFLYDGAPGGGDAFVVSGGKLKLAKNGGGIGTREYAIGGGVVGVGLLALVAGGGGGSNNANGNGNGNGNPPPILVTGDWSCGFVCIDNGGHPNRLPGTFTIQMSQNGNIVTFSSNASHFIDVSGPLTNNTVNAAGPGSYSGFPTEAAMTGMFDPLRTGFNGQYIAGTNGSLPGGNDIIWDVTCGRQ